MLRGRHGFYPHIFLPDFQAAVDSGVGCDMDGNGVVDVADVLTVLASWGPCAECPADISGDGVVGVGDLLTVLASWGMCR